MASNSKAVAENIGGTGEAAVQQNEKQIDNDYTIPAEFNAVMAGPVTLATSADITISTGSTLTIV